MDGNMELMPENDVLAQGFFDDLNRFFFPPAIIDFMRPCSMS